MSEIREFWPKWINTLQSFGLSGFVASFLESARPFSIIGTQVVYICQPFLPAGPRVNLTAFASMLEADEETTAFISLLRRSAT